MADIIVFVLLLKQNWWYYNIQVGTRYRKTNPSLTRLQCPVKPRQTGSNGSYRVKLSQTESNKIKPSQTGSDGTNWFKPSQVESNQNWVKLGQTESNLVKESSSRVKRVRSNGKDYSGLFLQIAYCSFKSCRYIYFRINIFDWPQWQSFGMEFNNLLSKSVYLYRCILIIRTQDLNAWY